MTKNLNDNSNVDYIEVPPEFQGTVEPISKLYNFLVDSEFVEISQFKYLTTALQEASEDDIVRIELSSPGGSLQAIIPLLNAIEKRQCILVVDIISDIASAATFIPMLADKVNVNDYVTIMLHNVSYGMTGSGGNNNSYVTHTTALTRDIISNLYRGFLTPSELKEILADGTKYMGKQEFIGRYYNRLVALGKQEPIHENKLEGNKSEDPYVPDMANMNTLEIIEAMSRKLAKS